MAVNYQAILLNFILGGIAVAGTSVLGTYMSPLAGAVFWSYPITIIPSLFFMKQEGKDNLYLSKFLLSTTFGVLLLCITTIAMGQFIKHSDKNASLWNPIGKGTLVYGAAGGLFFLIVKFAGLEHYFM